VHAEQVPLLRSGRGNPASLDERVETTNGHVSISTMHLAKGLEFRAAVVMACDDEIIPLQ
jgi:superfamily I DNA/RNA helicase